METIKLTYPSYTGITGIFFPKIKAEIKDNTISVECNGETVDMKIVIKPKTCTNDYIYKLNKTQLSLLKDDGIKFLINAQSKDDVFFTSARSLMNGIFKNKTGEYIF